MREPGPPGWTVADNPRQERWVAAGSVLLRSGGHLRTPNRGPRCTRSSPPRCLLLLGVRLERRPCRVAEAAAQVHTCVHRYDPQVGRRRRQRPGRFREEAVFGMGLVSPSQQGTSPLPSGSKCHLFRETFLKHLFYFCSPSHHLINYTVHSFLLVSECSGDKGEGCTGGHSAPDGFFTFCPEGLEPSQGFNLLRYAF